MTENWNSNPATGDGAPTAPNQYLDPQPSGYLPDQTPTGFDQPPPSDQAPDQPPAMPETPSIGFMPADSPGFVPESPVGPYSEQAWYPPTTSVPYPSGQSYQVGGQPYQQPGQPYQVGGQPYQPQWSAPGYQASQWPPAQPPQPIQLAQPKHSSRLIIGVIVGAVVLALVAAAVYWAINRTPADPNPPLPTGTATSTAPRPTSNVPGRASINETVTVDHPRYGPVDYTVTDSAEIMATIDGYFKAPAGMTFVIVPMTVTYQGTSPFVTLTSQDLVLVAGDSSRNSIDPTAAILYTLPDGSDNELWLMMFQPGQSIIGAAVFEIDQTAVAGSYLLVGASTSHAAEVDLGL